MTEEVQEAGKAGWTYAMFNHSMPNLVKIGETGNLEERRKGLSASTSVPTPFIILCAVYVPDCYKLEQDLHAFYSDRNSGKEFFTISHEEVVEKFLTLDGEPWVPAPTVVRDPSVIGWAGGGKYMTRKEKEAAGIDEAAILKRNRDMEVSETGREEAEVLDTKCGFSADQKQRGYKVKWELIKEICGLLGIPNTFTAIVWTYEQWILFTKNVILYEAIERAKYAFGFKSERKEGGHGAVVALKNDLEAVLKRWSGTTIVNLRSGQTIHVPLAPDQVRLTPKQWEDLPENAGLRAAIKAAHPDWVALGRGCTPLVNKEIGCLFKAWSTAKYGTEYDKGGKPISNKSVAAKTYALVPFESTYANKEY